MIINSLLDLDYYKLTMMQLAYLNHRDVVVEYALRDVHKPMGVASYHLTKKIPAELAQNLPSEKELKEILKDIDLKTTNKRV